MHHYLGFEVEAVYCNLIHSVQARLCPTLLTPWTVARPSVGVPRQEYWSGLPLPTPEDLPDPGIEPGSPALSGRVYQLRHLGRLNCHIIITMKELL